MSGDDPLHAGLIAARIDGRWAGALIEGPSGAGKSDLALRCLEAGFRLVADDRVILWTSGGRLFGRAPASLNGLIEARGLGIVDAAPLAFCPVALVVTCAAGPEVERMPERMTATRRALNLPAFTVWPFEPSAPAKLRRALQHLGLRP